MASLDSAIVNVAGPTIQQDLKISGPALQLVIYAYLLSYGIGLVTAARLGVRHGFGRIFSWGLLLFTASSLACGLAVSPGMLVAARITQGAGAALLVPQVLSILQVSFRGDRLRRAMSAYGLVLAVGVAVGQVLGGILVSANLFDTGWRPIFLVNVPIGVAVLLFVNRRLPAATRSNAGRLDLVGAGWLSVGILALVVPLTFGAQAGWPAWSWPTMAAAAAALTVFIKHEARLARDGREPLIDPRMIAQRGIRTGLGGIFVLHSSYGALLFTIALYLQHGLSQSPLRAGLTFAVYAVGFATASMTWTRLPEAWYPNLPRLALATFASACGILAWLTHTHGWPWTATVILLIAGAGHGTGFDSLAHGAAKVVPAEHTGPFSGALASVAQLAIVSGIAIGGTIYLHVANAIGLAPITTVFCSLVVALGAATAMNRRIESQSPERGN